MAKLPRSQPPTLSHGRHGDNASGGANTAPMNDLTIETVVITNSGGVYGEDSFGSINTGRPDEDH